MAAAVNACKWFMLSRLPSYPLHWPHRSCQLPQAINPANNGAKLVSIPGIPLGLFFFCSQLLGNKQLFAEP